MTARGVMTVAFRAVRADGMQVVARATGQIVPSVQSVIAAQPQHRQHELANEHGSAHDRAKQKEPG